MYINRNYIPQELLSQIFAYLSFSEQSVISQCCKLFKLIVTEEFFFKNTFLNLYTKLSNRKIFLTELNQTRDKLILFLKILLIVTKICYPNREKNTSFEQNLKQAINAFSKDMLLNGQNKANSIAANFLSGNEILNNSLSQASFKKIFNENLEDLVEHEELTLLKQWIDRTIKDKDAALCDSEMFEDVLRYCLQIAIVNIDETTIINPQSFIVNMALWFRQNETAIALLFKQGAKADDNTFKHAISNEASEAVLDVLFTNNVPLIYVISEIMSESTLTEANKSFLTWLSKRLDAASLQGLIDHWRGQASASILEILETALKTKQSQPSISKAS